MFFICNTFSGCARNCEDHEDQFFVFFFWNQEVGRKISRIAWKYFSEDLDMHIELIFIRE